MTGNRSSTRHRPPRLPVRCTGCLWRFDAGSLDELNTAASAHDDAPGAAHRVVLGTADWWPVDAGEFRVLARQASWDPRCPGCGQTSEHGHRQGCRHGLGPLAPSGRPGPPGSSALTQTTTPATAAPDRPAPVWKPGDPCNVCGSTLTGESPERGGWCNGCGAADSDDD